MNDPAEYEAAFDRGARMERERNMRLLLRAADASAAQGNFRSRLRADDLRVAAELLSNMAPMSAVLPWRVLAGLRSTQTRAATILTTRPL